VPSKRRRPSPPVDLDRSLGAAGEREYGQLVAMLRETLGRFALMPVRSNLPPSARDALLKRLAGDLDPIPVRVVRLTHDSYDAVRLVAEASRKLPAEGVVVLLGLESTPEIVSAPGDPPGTRPPALAVLNNGRQAFHKHCPYPLLLWTDRLTLRALAEHAPDFLDHFTGLFHFDDAAPSPADRPTPRPIPAEQPPMPSANAGLAVWAAALPFYEERVQSLTEPTVERARELLNLARALRSIRDARFAQHLERAEAAAREALSLVSFDEHPTDWAESHLVLGDILNEKPRGNRASNKKEAIACFRSTLRVYTEESTPLDWARTQINLGIAYLGLPSDDRDENLRQAIACYRSALHVYTEASTPLDWAVTQNNLGIAYRNLPSGDRDENMRQAIACYRAALRVYTEASTPLDWARTENNLGNAYGDLPSGDRDENVRQAIACYHAALRVYTEAAASLDWARVQYNLGNAHGDLPSGDRDENVRQAIACYHAALRVYTEETTPLTWAWTQNNLGLILLEARKHAEARRAFEAAARGFRSVGLEDEARDVEAIKETRIPRRPRRRVPEP
jgi:tetratricopeptide (TPR) repeat protein